jgi:hypothetical protein
MDNMVPTGSSILYDLDMVALSGGKERTLKEWTILIQSADKRLCISNIMRCPEFPAAIIEVRFVC